MPVNAGLVLLRQKLQPRGQHLPYTHRYTLRTRSRRTYLVGRALRTIGLDRGASLPESARFLATGLRYFVRQGHAQERT